MNELALNAHREHFGFGISPGERRKTDEELGVESAQSAAVSCAAFSARLCALLVSFSRVEWYKIGDVCKA